MNFLDNLYLDMKFKLKNFVSEMKEDESGVSNLVATVLLIVIVVAIAALLWVFLKEWFADVFRNITAASKNVGKN